MLLSCIKCYFLDEMLLFWIKCYFNLDKMLTILDEMLPWANFDYGPWDMVRFLSGPLKLCATWKSGPFWPIAQKKW